MTYVEVITHLSGLTNALHFTLINLYYGWGQLETIKKTIPITLCHNILDISLGQYWKTDKPLLIHHLIAILISLYVLTIKNFTIDLYNFSYWLSFAEITSIFNCLRWFFKRTKYQESLDLTFGISFLTIRPLTVIKTYTPAVNISYNLLIFWRIYTLLNIYWIYCIFKYSKKIKNVLLKLIE